MPMGGGWLNGGDQSALNRYGVALTSIAIAFIGRLALEPWLGDHMAYATLMVAVTCSAWYGGMGPGVVALVTAMAAAAWVRPQWHVLTWTLDGQELAKIALFVAMSLIVALMGDRARRLRLRDRERRQTLEDEVARRTREAEQRLTQLQLLHAELTQVEQRERRHLAHVLHDGLQQLLVVAKLRVAMLLRGNGSAPQPEQRDGELRQIEDLLAQSIEASRSLTVELFPPILADRGLVAALHWLGRHMAEKYHLRVEVDAHEDAEPGSEQTAVLMFHAARELLFNVVKHAGVDAASLSLRRRGGELGLTVRDTGRGVSPGEQAAWLGSGQGGASSRGFGLFAMQQRLEMVGGTMRVMSRPGDGTVVRLLVPDAAPAPMPAALRAPDAVEPAAPAMPPAASPTDASDASLRVLVVDDHQIVREGVMMLLRDQPGITVVAEASDGQMAVELAETFMPDVVLMDISMPRLDGIEATARIISARPRTRVIGLSMHQDPDVAGAMHRAGAAACLPKDSAGEVLITTIRRFAASPSAKTSGEAA